MRTAKEPRRHPRALSEPQARQCASEYIVLLLEAGPIAHDCPGIALRRLVSKATDVDEDALSTEWMRVVAAADDGVAGRRIDHLRLAAAAASAHASAQSDTIVPGGPPTLPTVWFQKPRPSHA